MFRTILLAAGILLGSLGNLFAQLSDVAKDIDNKIFDPSTLLWYQVPAKIWEEALPVGNGRLGAMVFGKNGEERIQLNEETYYTNVV